MKKLLITLLLICGSLNAQILTMYVADDGSANIDTIPSFSAFTPVADADLSTEYESNWATLTDYDSTTVQAGVYYYRTTLSGAWTSTDSVISSDSIQTKLTSSGSYSTASNSTIIVGGQSQTYTVTTISNPNPALIASDQDLGTFYITDGTPDSETYSDSLTLSVADSSLIIDSLYYSTTVATLHQDTVTSSGVELHFTVRTDTAGSHSAPITVEHSGSNSPSTITLTWDVDSAFTDTTNNWYVDQDATGTGDGTSWTNATTTVNAIFGKAIAGGDTIFVSGGTDSTVYGTVILWMKEYTSTVTVTKGTDAGHDGKVIFQNPDTDPLTQNSTVNLGHCNYIRLANITINTAVTKDSVAQQKSIVILANGENNSIDNCDIVSNGLGTCLFLSAQSDFSVTNSRLTVVHNEYASDADVIYIDNTGARLTIMDNILVNNKVNQSERHADIIQFGVFGDSTKPLVTIANNVLRSDYYDIEYNTGINTASLNANQFLIYNNIIAMTSTSSLPIIFYPDVLDADTPSSMKLFNNTIITRGTGYSIALGNIDSLWMKNNIVIIDTSISQMSLWIIDTLGISSMLEYSDIDYNLYWKNEGAYTGIIIDTAAINQNQSSGGRPSWAVWQGLGYDVNSSVDSAMFVNSWADSINAWKLDTGSPGIDEGADLSAYFTKDINGATRPKGSSWDIGAIESN